MWNLLFLSTGTLNLTLHLEGTHYEQPANWSVLNAYLLQARSPWLRVPVLSGVPLITSPSTNVLVPIVLSATGLRESSVPYVESL